MNVLNRILFSSPLNRILLMHLSAASTNSLSGTDVPSESMFS